MKLRTLVEFTTTIPDDAVENEAGDDFLVWPGRNVVEAIAEILVGLGCTTEPPEDLQFAGWSLSFRTQEGHPISGRYSDTGEERYLDLKDHRQVGFLARTSGPVFVDFLQRFGQAFAEDPRFGDLVWYVVKARGRPGDPGDAPVSA
jgi:hypothetical protein